MASKTEICNMALSHISSHEISDFDLDKGEEAKVCRIFYDVALNAILRDFYWPFATRTKALSPASSNGDPEWSYAYRYPSDCVDVKRIPFRTRMETGKKRIPFKISNDDVGLIILTDLAGAYAEYTVNNVSTERFPPDFVLAFSYKLATVLAPRVTGADVSKVQSAVALYDREIGNARANALNEGQPDPDPASEFELARF